MVSDTRATWPRKSAPKFLRSMSQGLERVPSASLCFQDISSWVVLCYPQRKQDMKYLREDWRVTESRVCVLARLCKSIKTPSLCFPQGINYS